MSRQEVRYVAIDGLKTFYIKAGEGCPLFLIHGGAPGASSTVSWKKNIDYFAASGFSVYAFDQPGFGSTDNPKDYSIEYRVAHAQAFIQSLRPDRFHVIGNSQGAYIAARIALADKRIGGLVLVSSGTLAPKGSAQSDALAQGHSEELSAYTPSIENMRALTQGTIFHKELVTEELVKERYEMSAGKNYTAQLARKKAGRAKPIQEELKNLKCGTLIFWGNNDRGAALERALLLYKIIPGAELHVFDNCAHWVQWDQADSFNRMTADFLKSLD